MSAEDRRQDVKGRDRISEIERKVDGALEQLHAFIRNVSIMLVLLLLAQIGLAVSGVVIRLAQADTNNRLIGDNANRITDIQGSRLKSCHETNHRHDATLARLHTLDQTAARRAPGELVHLFGAAGISITLQQRKALAAFELSQAPASEAQTASLINALAPRRNCRQLISSKPVGAKSPPPAAH